MAQFGFSWEVELVATGEDFILLFGSERVFYDRIIFVRAENQTEGGIVTFSHAFAIVIIDIQLNLSEVAVGELTNFEIDQDVALEDGVKNVMPPVSCKS